MGQPTSATSAKREAILTAAKELFARQGLAATSIKAIAERAGVNSALIYYYFADKEALYEAVLVAVVSRLPDGLQAVVREPAAPRDALAAIIRGQAALFVAEPAMARLIARELADHEAAHATDMLRNRARALLARIAALIRQGQATRSFDPRFDPELAAVSVMSQVNWFCIAGPAIEQILGRPGAARDPVVIRRFAEHVVQFSLAGLAPAPEAT